MNSKYSKLRLVYLFVCFFIGSTLLSAQTTVTLNADGPGNTYERIDSAFGSGASSEVPDNFPSCNTIHSRHITEAWDSTLNKYVFLFKAYYDPPDSIDYDRCSNTDRQRIEIKTVASNVTGGEGALQVYKWKFKIDSLFQPSPNFCHLHQIKHTGGSDDGAPIMTITPRHYSDTTQPEWLQLIFTPSTGGSGGGMLDQVELAPLKGIWLEVTEQALFSDAGKYEVTIKKLDGTVVMHYINYYLDMSRGKPGYHRGKWGIYRSLNSPSYLRNETVKFSDFQITSVITYPTPGTPTNLKANSISSSEIDLTWKNNSDDKTNFLIQRSIDGMNWTNVTAANENDTSFNDYGLNDSTTYYYRIRSENWNVFSSFTDSVYATTFSKVHESDINLALNKMVTCSSEQLEGGTGDNPCVNAVDGDTLTRWSSARDSTWPQWIEVDLDSVITINKTEVICYNDRAYQFTIEVKTDSDGQYSQVVDRSNNMQPGSVASPITDVFDSIKARYVRLTVTGADNYAGPWTSIIEFKIFNSPNVTGVVKQKNNIPSSFILSQNYPNPFNPSTVISYQIPKASYVKLIVYDIMGREVTRLADGFQQAGKYNLTWNTENVSGENLASGTYFARLQAGYYVKTIKLLLLK